MFDFCVAFVSYCTCVQGRVFFALWSQSALVTPKRNCLPKHYFYSTLKKSQSVLSIEGRYDSGQTSLRVVLIQGVSLAIGPKIFLITFKVIDVI
jgi:hypothetical protein